MYEKKHVRIMKGKDSDYKAYLHNETSRLKNYNIFLGFHLSTKGSILNPLEEAISFGYTAVQLFLFNPRAWEGKAIDDNTIKAFSALLKKNAIKVDVHIPYLCNPSSPNEEVYKKSRDMLIQNASVCAMLNIPLVIHLGSHLNRGFSYSFDRLTKLLNYVLDNTDVEILLENSAGYRNSVGSTLDELAEILNASSSNRLGLCIDTAHAFAAGYNIATKSGVDSFANELELKIGVDKIKLFHLNDSKYALGSGLDRHWHIGKGFIGANGFLNFFSNKYFSKGTFIMETPVNNDGDEVENMKSALNIIKKALNLNI
ncbi:MAG: deoxyribonuclease IV [Candidatus Micrarchaeia archaeon]